MSGVIMVSDFGLTEDMYATNYFRKDSSESGNDEKVPIRWMAPESINSELYNEKTDVVSFFSCFVALSDKFCFPVVIWSDVLGGVHMWPGAISWNTCHEAVQCSYQWRETGQTNQLCLQ